jgi:hypothetical protein
MTLRAQEEEGGYTQGTRRRGYTVRTSNYIRCNDHQEMTAGEVHPTQGDANPLRIARKQVLHTYSGTEEEGVTRHIHGTAHTQAEEGGYMVRHKKEEEGVTR